MQFLVRDTNNDVLSVGLISKFDFRPDGKLFGFVRRLSLPTNVEGLLFYQDILDVRYYIFMPRYKLKQKNQFYFLKTWPIAQSGST